MIVDDDADVLATGALLLKRAGFEPRTASSPDEAWTVLADDRIDAVLLDLNFARGATSGAVGLAFLDALVAHDPGLPVVVVTGHSGVNIAVAAMRAGASDFVMKPWNNDRLIGTLRGVLTKRSERMAISAQAAVGTAASDEVRGGDGVLIGESAAIRRVRDLIERVGPSAGSVLIRGEAGSGRHLVARAFHRRSERSSGPFVRFDATSVPVERMEEALFGDHRGGDGIRGAVFAAGGGTLYVKEVGTLSPSMQGLLLSAIEQRSAVPLGSRNAEAVRFRIIASTSIGRARDGSVGPIREDLLLALNTIEIELPPLSDRGDDVILIAEHFLRLYAKRHGRLVKPLTPEALGTLRAAEWHGNVRALRQVIERAVLLGEDASFGLRDLTSTAVFAAKTQHEVDFDLTRTEKSLITAALDRHAFNVSRAARELGLTRAALYRRMSKHGL